MAPYVPKTPYGHIPGRDFIDLGGTAHGYRIGVIQRVDEFNMKADVRVITGGGFRAEIDLTQGMCGPRSFWGGVPEVGSMVILGYRAITDKLGDAMILGYLPVGNKLGLRFDPLAPSDPTQVAPEDAQQYKALFGGPVRYKRFKFAPGDVGGMSSSGAEMHLSKSVSLTDRAGDLIELRDEERTLVTQAIHRFDNDAGVTRYSGPIRRQVFYLPPEVYTTNTAGVKTLLTEAEGYFGRDDLQAVGPGPQGAAGKFANEAGELLEYFNDAVLFPPVTYSNGKTVFYPSTTPGVSPEGKIEDGAGSAYTEQRTEIAHDTDLMQEVHTEIDGFTPNPRRLYIEHVMGTVVGNDPYSTQGIKQYGQVLRPQLWTAAASQTAGRFSLEPVVRGVSGDLEARTAAAAYLLRILGPESNNDDVPFAVSVQKQGKLLVQIPKPSNEFYGDSVKGVSADINLLGALKLFVGRATPTNTSVYAKLDGGIKAEIGRNTDTGNSLDIVYMGPVRHNYTGVPDENGVGLNVSVMGHSSTDTSGDHNVSTGGSLNQVANGALTLKGDKIVQQAFSGYTLNAGGLQQTVMGASFLTCALLKTETIATGGEVKTILAGVSNETVAAGAKNVLVSGPIGITSGAAMATTAGGALAMTAGGAATMTSGGATSITSGAAIAVSSGALMTLTAPAGILLTSTNIQLGGPTGVFGVARGTPALPPGIPTLDYITGLPLLGSAAVRSI